MNESFKSLQKGFLTVGIIKSVLAALAAGLGVCGIFLLLADFELVKIKLIFIVLMSIAAFIVAGGITAFLTYRTERGLAKQLDTELGLEQRLSTMVQFRGEKGVMLDLQREDANQKLDAAMSSKICFKLLWVFVIAFVLGAAMFITGLLLKPAPTPPPPTEELPFKLTAIQESALSELANEIKASGMSSPYREEVALQIEILLDELKNSNTVTQRDSAIKKAHEEILRITDESSFALEVINGLGASESTAARAMAIAINYYDWTLGDEWDSFCDAMTEVRTRLSSTAESEAQAAQDLKDLLTAIGYNISLSLLGASVPQSDALFESLDRYVTADTYNGNSVAIKGFNKLVEALPDYGYTSAQQALDDLFNFSNIDLFISLEQDATDTGTGEYAVTRICEIFNTNLPKFERPSISKKVENDNKDETTNDNVGGGGIGVGTVYGSNDLVLDPDTDELVEYGTIIDKYYSQMFGKQQDGDYTEEEKQAMKKYFEILYGGFDKE